LTKLSYYDILLSTAKHLQIYYKKPKGDTSMQEKSILDKLGRISIPKEVREEIGFGANDIFEIEAKGGKIMLLKANEESLKVKRSVDPTGRLVIPIEIRQALNYKEGDNMEITVERILLISKI